MIEVGSVKYRRQWWVRCETDWGSTYWELWVRDKTRNGWVKGRRLK